LVLETACAIAPREVRTSGLGKTYSSCLAPWRVGPAEQATAGAEPPLRGRAVVRDAEMGWALAWGGDAAGAQGLHARTRGRAGRLGALAIGRGAEREQARARALGRGWAGGARRWLGRRGARRLARGRWHGWLGWAALRAHGGKLGWAAARGPARECRCDGPSEGGKGREGRGGWAGRAGPGRELG
jgi:hypothetical protein